MVQDRLTLHIIAVLRDQKTRHKTRAGTEKVITECKENSERKDTKKNKIKVLKAHEAVDHIN